MLINQKIINQWEWNGQEIHGAYVYYITKDVGATLPYLFGGFSKDPKCLNGRLWTRDKSKVAIFSDDKEARRFIEKHFTQKEQSKLLIVREG